MTYVSVVTMVAYMLLLAGLVAVSVIDARTRRIPNALVGLIGLLWLAWRLVLGFAGKYMGLGFWATLFSPAPMVLGRWGVPIVGVSLSEGLIGAVVLGGGLLVLSALYEFVFRKESFGGGDIKLMAVLGLFLGWERGLICILIACVLGVAYMGIRTLVAKRRAFDGALAADEVLAVEGNACGEAVAGVLLKPADKGGDSRGTATVPSDKAVVADNPEPSLGDAVASVKGCPPRHSFLGETMPFAPFITVGAILSLVA